MEIRQKGATSNTFYVMIRSTATTPTGKALTGLVYNTSGLLFYYTRDLSAAVAITLVTLAAVTTAWASGGFKEIDATNAPGLYRLDVPDAAFVTGKNKVRINWTGANSFDDGVECVLTDYDPTAIDKAGYALSSAGNNSVRDVIISDATAFAGADVAAIKGRLPAALTANGNMKSSLMEILTTALTETAGLLAGGFKKFFNIATPVSTMDLIAGTTNAPTAGDLTATMKTSVQTAASAATPVATVSGDLSATMKTSVAAAVLDTAASGHNTAATIGAKINSAAAAGDPLSSAVPGSYAAGTAGAALGALPTDPADESLLIAAIGAGGAGTNPLLW